MTHHIKHEQDVLNLIRQNLERDKLVEFMRNPEEKPEPDIFAGHASSVDCEGPLNTGMVFAIVALAVVGAAILLNWK